jgi:hypothetical protein
VAITALIGAQLHIIGVMEIAFVALFVLPATSKGFHGMASLVVKRLTSRNGKNRTLRLCSSSV